MEGKQNKEPTCVAIWLISMAARAGLSQPLLLMTSTMACEGAQRSTARTA